MLFQPQTSKINMDAKQQWVVFASMPKIMKDASAIKYYVSYMKYYKHYVLTEVKRQNTSYYS